MPNLRFITCLSLFLLLTACNLGVQSEATSVTTPTQGLPEPQQATPTQATEVARVNGEAITQEAFQRHLALYRAAQDETGTLLATEEVERIVLDDLIARLLLAQAARAEGFLADEALLQERLSALVEEAGGQSAFDAWLDQHGYTIETFEEDLAIEIEAAWMRNEITASMSQNAEQVEARQILLSDLFQAERLLGQLEGGTSFETVVINNDPQRLGYLGWFPRGYLLQPEVEDAAFALQPGEHSDIVETQLGYHLIEVLDRDSERALSPLARLKLQMQALEDWLAEQRELSEIEIFLP